MIHHMLPLANLPSEFAAAELFPVPDTSEGTRDHGNHGPNGQGETTVIEGRPGVLEMINVDQPVMSMLWC